MALVKQGLAVLADNAVADVDDDDLRRHVVVRVIDEIIVALMGRACGLSYAEVATDMEWHDMSGVRVPVASPAALLRTKNTYRPQDAIDRSFLQQLLDQRRRP